MRSLVVPSSPVCRLDNAHEHAIYVVFRREHLFTLGTRCISCYFRLTNTGVKEVLKSVFSACSYFKVSYQVHIINRGCITAFFGWGQYDVCGVMVTDVRNENDEPE